MRWNWEYFVFQKTKIGMIVNNFRKAANKEDVINLAKSLIKSWKKLLPTGMLNQGLFISCSLILNFMYPVEKKAETGMTISLSCIIPLIPKDHSLYCLPVCATSLYHSDRLYAIDVAQIETASVKFVLVLLCCTRCITMWLSSDLKEGVVETWRSNLKHLRPKQNIVLFPASLAKKLG